AKAAVELPSPWEGTVGKLLVEPGVTVEVGTPIITIDTGGGAAAQADDEAVPNLVGYGPRQGTATRRRRKGAAPPPQHDGRPQPAPTQLAPPAEPAPEPVGAVPLAKPPVRKLAKDLGVDLRTVRGTGEGGVITRADVEAAAAAARGAAAPAASAGGVRREPIRGVRKATATAVASSAFTAPHVTEFLTVDVTAGMELVRSLGASQGYAGKRVTILTLVAKALLLAAKRTPEVNSRWDDETQEIVQFGSVNLGIAAATGRGLIVPNIKRADA